MAPDLSPSHAHSHQFADRFYSDDVAFFSSIFLQWRAVCCSLKYLPRPFSFLYLRILTRLIKMLQLVFSSTNPHLYVAAERLKHQMTSSETDLIACNELIVLWGFFPTAAMRLLSGLLLSVLCIWALFCNQETWVFINAHIQTPQDRAVQTTRCWPQPLLMCLHMKANRWANR